MNNKISENKRSSNFSKEEEYLLVSLVEKYKAIIECKKSNVTTWKDKERTWLRIEKEFNSNSGRNGYRTVKNLKEKYNNLKKTTKKKFSENKMKITQTGGGCYVPTPVSDIDITIKDILGEQIDGLKNTYDSDTVDIDLEDNYTGIGSEIIIDHNIDHDYVFPTPTFEDSVVISDGNHEAVANNSDEEPHPSSPGNISQEKTDDKENDWSHYSSQRLRQPVSSKLIVNKEGKKKNVVLTRSNKVQKKIINKNTQLIEEKLDFVRLQKQKFLEEHHLKMEIYRKKLDKLNSKV